MTYSAGAKSRQPIKAKVLEPESIGSWREWVTVKGTVTRPLSARDLAGYLDPFYTMVCCLPTAG
jgi:hypothetical protein